MCPAGREDGTKEVVERVGGRQIDEVARTALEHRYMASAGLLHRGQDCDSCGSATDDDDLLADVVKLLRPELGVDHLAFE